MNICGVLVMKLNSRETRANKILHWNRFETWVTEYFLKRRMGRQHCLLTICIELVELTVSDDKIQITILILRRGALSSKDGIEDEDGRRGSLWDYQVETTGLESFIEIR